MNRATLPLAIAVICVAIAVFYLVPGPSHPFVAEDPAGQHVKHALLFFGLAALALIWARFAANARPRADRPPR